MKKYIQLILLTAMVISFLVTATMVYFDLLGIIYKVGYISTIVFMFLYLISLQGDAKELLEKQESN